MSTRWCDLSSSQNIMFGRIWLKPRHWVFWKDQNMNIQKFSHFPNMFGKLALMQVDRYSICTPVPDRVLRQGGCWECPEVLLVSVKGKVMRKSDHCHLVLFIFFLQHPFSFPVAHSSCFFHAFSFVCLFAFPFLCAHLRVSNG